MPANLATVGAMSIEVIGSLRTSPAGMPGPRIRNGTRRDGSWENDNGRWWEKDPALATSYCLLSLGIAAREL